MRRIAFAVAILFVFAAAFIFWRLGDHDLSGRRSAPLSFAAGDNRLSGTVWLPDGEPIAAIVLVHGDGPQDRTSDGGYTPLVNVLLDHGIAVASWDKPGVGASSGNWLDQTMADRAREVSAALNALAGAGALGDLPRGALGFSQAGWVLPKLSANEADFILLVSPAVSWEQQGRFYTRRRLERAGESKVAIDQALARNVERNDRLFGADARFDEATAPDGMDRDRWEFVRRNRKADATADLATLDVPTLAIWGQEDLNVDAAADAAIYRAILSARHPANRMVVIPDATHGLLKAGPYNYQLADQWPLWAKASFLVEGRLAYAPGALDAITGFVAQAATAGHGRRGWRESGSQKRLRQPLHACVGSKFRFFLKHAVEADAMLSPVHAPRPGLERFRPSTIEGWTRRHREAFSGAVAR